VTLLGRVRVNVATMAGRSFADSTVSIPWCTCSVGGMLTGSGDRDKSVTDSAPKELENWRHRVAMQHPMPLVSLSSDQQGVIQGSFWKELVHCDLSTEG
jgi:hypothetical protein